jgi:hypothetical protein
MPLYDDPVEMFEVIREHVRVNGHRVMASDNPLGQALGYTCLDCMEGADGLPLTVSWHVGLVVLKAVLEAHGIPLRGVLSSQAGRKRLTDYLNGVGEFAPPVPAEVIRVSRYKREPVI